MSSEGKMSAVLEGKAEGVPPVWLMRQAGRYLPEYREVRAKAGSFWKMCLTPELAAEVTLQPIRRFGFDAAILFSDILTVPSALGITVTFEVGEGPSLKPIEDSRGLVVDRAAWERTLCPAYEALGLVKPQLPAGTALLGFAGAPWTLATYLAAGKGGDEQKAAKLWGYRDPEGFDRLLGLLADCVSFHLLRQLESGADAVQIFDSWASGLPEIAYARWVVAPTKSIVSNIRTKYPKAKIIGFPRASTLAGYELYAREVGVDALSLDTAVPMPWAAKTLAPHVALQGNLDPLVLVAGGRALSEHVEAILSATRGKRFIFNLGHGILQETPTAHVERLMELVRKAS